MLKQISIDPVYKILLIEDNPGDARLVELSLRDSESYEYQIVHCQTLADGMARLEDNEFAAILLDLSLPDSRGFETLEELLEKYPDNNVIVMTGDSNKTLGFEAVKAGAQDFLFKDDLDAEGLEKSLRFSIERKKAFKRLEDTQRQAKIGNWECHRESGYFYASPEIYRIFGYSTGSKALSYNQLKKPLNPISFFEEIHNLAVHAKEVRQESKIKQLNGDTRYVYVKCTANQLPDKTYIFYGILQDVTELKEAELEMAKSQERYLNLFSQSKDAIYISTLDGKVIDYNQATADLLGLWYNEVSKVNIHDYICDEERREHFLQQLWQEKTVKDFELEFHSKNGHIKYCALTANLTENEEFVGYNCVVRDLTARKEAEAFKAERDRAAQEAEIREQFIANVSHEMRTPMNAILGMSNLLLELGLGSEQKNYVQSIKQSSEILLGVINDILEMASIQHGKVAFENEEFNLHEVLNNLSDVMQYKISEKDLLFELELNKKVPQLVKGDKLRLNQILYNLVGNAIKFTDTGHVKVYVIIKEEDADRIHLEFSVEDTGIGIPKDKLEAIFKTFSRIKQKDRLYEGTGLGLAIAKNLVIQQGGQIWADSEEGKGSRFYFNLWFEKVRQSEKLSGRVKVEAINIDQTRDFRLLLVEDHKMNQLVARKTIENKWGNLKVTIAENGLEAIEHLEKEPFDIVLMDLQMPIMDGYTATQHIRQKMPPAIKHIPILAMTAHALISKDEKFREYGMDDYVLKPFDPEQLFSKIAQFLK